MVKLLVLQQWCGLSDPELERQASNRIDFMHFLGYPEQPPDYSTVWSFRERLAATRTDELVWAELQRQLDAKGFRVRKGVAQDASFIEADPGGSGPRGEEARTRRSRDGDWAKRKDGSTPVERVFAVVKRVFNGGRVLVTLFSRVRVKLVFSCFCFNLVQMGSLGAVS